MWTKKHDEFAMICKLRPSTKLLLRWLLRRAKPNDITELEIDLSEFNQWISKTRGRPYDRKTLREAMSQLDEMTNGLIVVMKNYNPWVKKIIVRPLSFVVEKKPPKLGNVPNSSTGKPMFDAEQKKRVIKQQQQDISNLRSIFSNLGMKYTDDALLRMWRYAGQKLGSVKRAISYMLYSHNSKIIESNDPKDGIIKPHGWLMECLKYGWHDDWDNYYVTNGVNLPRITCSNGIDELVDRIFKPDNPQPQT